MKKDSPAPESQPTSALRQKIRPKKLLAVLLYFLVLFLLLQVEIDDFRMGDYIPFLIKISIAFIICRIFRKSSGFRIWAYLTAGGIVLLSGLGLLVTLTGFCATGKHGIFYVNKADSAVCITGRTFGCFMTTDDLEFYKERQIAPHIKWVTKLDSRPTDTTQWREIPFGMR